MWEKSGFSKFIQKCHLVAANDLARIYQCANGTKTINLAVKRHVDRFPDDFYFQLAKKIGKLEVSK